MAANPVELDRKKNQSLLRDTTQTTALNWLSQNEDLKEIHGWQLKDVKILGSEKGMLAGMLLLLFHPSPSFLVLSRRLVGARH